MGISMLLIIFHHMPGYLPPILSFIRANSGIGVDIFLFLSGCGMFLSLKKNPNTIYFYKKRCWRIFPTYIIVVLCYNLSIGQGDLNIINIMWQVSTIGLWLYKSCYDWYIPALIILYAISPIIYKFLISTQSTKWILFPAILGILLIAYSLGFHYINIFFPRIPVFILGFCLPLIQEYLTKKRKKTQYIIIIGGGIIGLYIESMLYHNFEINFRSGIIYFPYLLIVPALLLVMIKLCSLSPRWINTYLSFIGGMTLEIYLIHLHILESFHDIQKALGLSKPTTAAFIIIFIFFSSYLLHTLLSNIIHSRTSKKTT